MEIDEALIVSAMRCAIGDVVHQGVERRTTLVFCKSEAVARSSQVTVRRLDREDLKTVTSFSTACRLLVGNAADQVVIIETDELKLDEFEVDVIRRLSQNLPVLRVSLSEKDQNPLVSAGAGASLPQLPGSDAMEARLGRLSIERYSRWFSVDNHPTHISVTEAELLWALVSAPTGVVSTAKLKSVFRNPAAPGSSSLLRQYILRLRRKLTGAGRPAVILSIRGGYCLRLP
jgi:DNA-binding response OmpR family regulator